MSLGWFRHADLRFETFAANHIVPALQALVLAWWLGSPSAARGLTRLRRALSDPLAPVVLGLEAVVLLAGLAWPTHPMFGLAVTSPVPRASIGTTLVAAGVVFGLVSRTARSRWIACAALMLVGLGLQAFWPWSDAAIALAARRVPTVVRWLAIDVPAFGAVLLVVLSAADRLDEDPRAWVHAALAFFALVALISVVGLFLRPYFVEPWGMVVRVAASLSSACLLVASLRALRREPGPPGTPPSRRLAGQRP